MEGDSGVALQLDLPVLLTGLRIQRIELAIQTADEKATVGGGGRNNDRVSCSESPPFLTAEDDQLPPMMPGVHHNYDLGQAADDYVNQ